MLNCDGFNYCDLVLLLLDRFYGAIRQEKNGCSMCHTVDGDAADRTIKKGNYLRVNCDRQLTLHREWTTVIKPGLIGINTDHYLAQGGFMPIGFL